MRRCTPASQHRLWAQQLQLGQNKLFSRRLLINSLTFSVAVLPSVGTLLCLGHLIATVSTPASTQVIYYCVSTAGVCNGSVDLHRGSLPWRLSIYTRYCDAVHSRFVTTGGNNTCSTCTCTCDTACRCSVMFLRAMFVCRRAQVLQCFITLVFSTCASHQGNIKYVHRHGTLMMQYLWCCD